MFALITNYERGRSGKTENEKGKRRRGRVFLFSFCFALHIENGEKNPYA